MACCIVYLIVFYIGLIAVYSCQNQFDYSSWSFGGPCYFYSASDFALHTVHHCLAPVYDLRCHHTVLASSFLIRVEFSLSQLLLICIQPPLSHSMSTDFTRNQRKIVHS